MSSYSGDTSAGTVFERQYRRTLNPYSRMALAVRGWGLEGILALGLFVLWRMTTALDGEGLGILLLGSLGIVRLAQLGSEDAPGVNVAGPLHPALVQPSPPRM